MIASAARPARRCEARDSEGNSCGFRTLGDAGRCLAHSDSSAISEVLQLIASGAPVDHFTGATITHEFWEELRRHLPGDATGHRTLHRPNFTGCVFEGPVILERGVIDGPASFTGATWREACSFSQCTFLGEASFAGATFDHAITFHRSAFSKGADFQGATFKGNADFSQVDASQDVDFAAARLHEGITLGGVSEPRRFRLDWATVIGPVDPAWILEINEHAIKLQLD